MHDLTTPSDIGGPTTGRRRARAHRVAALSVVGVAGLAFAACGGSSSASTTPSTAPARTSTTPS